MLQRTAAFCCCTDKMLSQFRCRFAHRILSMFACKALAAHFHSPGVYSSLSYISCWWFLYTHRLDKECCACFRNIVISFLKSPFFTGLFFCLLQITSLGGITAALPFLRTALRSWRHRENQNETGTKKKEVTWAKLRRECFHCAQAPNK